jgi:dipeptidyl aminopeptidase/acylaminoacyl peptidase
MISRLFAIALAPTAFAQVPENLTVQDLPPIVETTRQSAGRYLEFRSASFQSWHPQRHEMLIVTRFAETPQIHLLKQPSGARRQLTFLPEPVAGASFRPEKGDCFVYAQDIGGGEFYQLYRYDLADGRSTLLTDGKSRNTSPRWSHSGRSLAYTSTRRSGKDNDIYVIDPNDPKTDRRVLEVQGGGWSVLDWSHDEKTLLLGEYLSANESRLHLLDLASGQAARLSPESDKKVMWAGGVFSPDGQTIYTVTDRDGEFQQLATIDRGDKSVRILTSDIPWDVDDFDLSGDGQLLAIATNEEGISKLRLLNPKSGRTVHEAKTPPGVISGIRWHEDRRTLGFSLNAAQSPTDVWSLDATSKELTRWTESETGGLNPATFSEPALMRIESFDGTKMSGFLYRPKAGRFPGKRPCLVIIHGGPEAQSQAVFLGRYNYFIDELGIALFFPNVRGSSGFGKTFLTLDNGFKREDSVRDIGAFLDALARDPALDASRFAVTGGSYGGYMTLASLIHFGDQLRCGVCSFGISNFLTFLQNTQDYRRDLRRVEYGDERDPKMAEFLAQISPSARAHEIKRPLFLVHGKNDPRVPVTEAKQIAAEVRKNGTTVAYLEAADEGHGFAKKKNADFLFLTTVEFLREHLLRKD